MLTAEEHKIVEAAALAAIIGVMRLGGYNRPPMLKVPKETAWRLYSSIIGVPASANATPDDFAKWRTHAAATLGTILGDDSPLVAELRAISVEPESAIAGGLGADYDAKRYKQGCDEALSLLLALNQRIEAAPDDPPTFSPAGNRAKSLGYTMIHVTKAEALQKLRAAADSVPKDRHCDSEMFHDWFNRTLSDVKAIFGADSDKAKRFAEINFKSRAYFRQRLSDVQSGRRSREDQNEQHRRECYEEGCETAEQKLREWIELVAYEPDVPPNPAPAKENIVGNFGEIVRGDFKMMHREQGKPVIILKNYGKADQSERRIRALKVNNDGDAFQFLDVIDVVPGDVIQEEGSTKIWRVTDTTEHTEDGVFTEFEASVERHTPGVHPQPPSGGIYIGTNYGPVQAHSPHGTQHATVNINQQVLELVNKIKASTDRSDELDDLDKEEVRHQLDRVCDIAKGPPTAKTKATINDKLVAIEKTISVATKTAALVTPWIVVLREYLRTHGH
jgi:hypothetical protein